MLKKLLDRKMISPLFLLLATAVLYLPSLGAYPFWDPWESQYSQVAMEMGEKGTWLDPYYRGVNNWWSKPIMLMWLLRASFGLFGVTDTTAPWLHFAGRLPLFFIGLAGVLLTFYWVSGLVNRRAGLLSALALLTSPMYALIHHQVMYDGPFVVFCSAAVGLFFLARKSARPLHLLLFYLLCGLAFLSKWLLAFFIPAGILLVEIFLRWDFQALKKMGWWPLASALVFILSGSLAFYLATRDPVFSLMLAVVLLGLALIWLMGGWLVAENQLPARYWHLGFGLLMILILPWHIYMIAKHGMPFVREVVIYHHFDRAAGTIGKPEGTFDIYFQQLAFGTFPWVALLPAAFLKLFPRRLEKSSGKDDWTLQLFLAALVPWAAFSLFQTKFHHYIFPVVPFLAVIVGVFLDRLRSEQEGDWIKVTVMLAVPVLAVMLADIQRDYKYFIHLFDYYYGWPLPAAFNPYPALLAAGGCFLLLVLVLFFRRQLGAVLCGGLFVSAAALILALCAWVLPRVANNFSQYLNFQAYLEKGKGEPIAQYNGWLSRSVSFYFRNRAVDLSRGDRPNLDAAIEFLSRPSRSFIILGAGYGLECRQLLASLRPEVQRRLGKSLYIVDDRHAFSCLASTERDPEGQKKVQQSILTALPENITKASVNFDDKIELIGWRVEPAQLERGGTFRVYYYFRCLKEVGDDWLVFIHGDGPQGGAHRIFGDHAPVGGLYPTGEWKPGEIIEDSVEMQVPANYPFPNFTLWMGFWKGELRLPVTQKFMHDGADRVRTAMVTVK